MKLQILKLSTWEYPSHSMIGQNLYWGSVYTIDSEECFSEGANVLVGNITKGGWALTHALACLKSKYKKTTNMKIDGENCSLHKMRKISFYVGDCKKKIQKKRTAKEIICKCSSKWEKAHLQQLLKEFGIDESAESFCKEPMCNAGKDIWKYSVVIGVLLKKEIFLFPWVSSGILQEIQEDIVRIGRALKERNLIMLLPVENDSLLRMTDLEYERCVLTQVCGEKMQRERVTPHRLEVEYND